MDVLIFILCLAVTHRHIYSTDNFASINYAFSPAHVPNFHCKQTCFPYRRLKGKCNFI